MGVSLFSLFAARRETVRVLVFGSPFDAAIRLGTELPFSTNLDFDLASQFCVHVNPLPLAQQVGGKDLRQ